MGALFVRFWDGRVLDVTTMTMDDQTLLRNYAAKRTEGDFAELVRRHVDFVYSTALRQVNGDAHLAQDVTQLVFTDVARKAAALVGHRALAGWLHTSTRYAAAKLVRSEVRRRDRERESQHMHITNDGDGAAAAEWEKVRPVLDEALGEMEERDREAIILRLIEGRDYGEVGARLTMTANAARMRTDRALDKLRAALARRGITSSAGALALALGNHALTAAPVGMAGSVTAGALGGAAATGAGVGGLVFMSMSKLQIGLVAGLVAAGAGGYVWQQKEAEAAIAELAATKSPAMQVATPSPRHEESAKIASTEVELARLESDVARLQTELASATTAGATQRSVPRYTMDQLDKRPKVRVHAQPKYPAAMRQGGIEGQVIVGFDVNADGEVESVRVISSSRPEFESSALEAVRTWQFVPGEKNGAKVVSGDLQQAIRFQVAGKAEAPATWF